MARDARGRGTLNRGCAGDGRCLRWGVRPTFGTPERTDQPIEEVLNPEPAATDVRDIDRPRAVAHVAVTKQGDVAARVRRSQEGRLPGRPAGSILWAHRTRSGRRVPVVRAETNGALISWAEHKYPADQA